MARQRNRHCVRGLSVRLLLGLLGAAVFAASTPGCQLEQVEKTVQITAAVLMFPIYVAVWMAQAQAHSREYRSGGQPY